MKSNEDDSDDSFTSLNTDIQNTIYNDNSQSEEFKDP